MELETQRKTLYMTSKVIFILYCDVNVWTPAGNTDVHILICLCAHFLERAVAVYDNEQKLKHFLFC